MFSVPVNFFFKIITVLFFAKLNKFKFHFGQLFIHVYVCVCEYLKQLKLSVEYKPSLRKYRTPYFSKEEVKNVRKMKGKLKSSWRIDGLTDWLMTIMPVTGDDVERLHQFLRVATWRDDVILFLQSKWRFRDSKLRFMESGRGCVRFYNYSTHLVIL